MLCGPGRHHQPDTGGYPGRDWELGRGVDYRGGGAGRAGAVGGGAGEGAAGHGRRWGGRGGLLRAGGVGGAGRGEG